MSCVTIRVTAQRRAPLRPVGREPACGHDAVDARVGARASAPQGVEDVEDADCGAEMLRRCARRPWRETAGRRPTRCSAARVSPPPPVEEQNSSLRRRRLLQPERRCCPRAARRVDVVHLPNQRSHRSLWNGPVPSVLPSAVYAARGTLHEDVLRPGERRHERLRYVQGQCRSREHDAAACHRDRALASAASPHFPASPASTSPLHRSTDEGCLSRARRTPSTNSATWPQGSR